MQFTIRQARTHAGLTQAETAKRLGIDRGTYMKIEKDPSKATIQQINMLSSITSIPVKNIFLGCNSAFADKQAPSDVQDNIQRGQQSA